MKRNELLICANIDESQKYSGQKKLGTKEYLLHGLLYIEF